MSAIKAPKQPRSRQTMERFVKAAIRLLDTRLWDDIGVSQLAAAAGSSVGSFYGRFGDKQALLDLLDERYADELTTWLAQHVQEARARRLPLAERVRQFITEGVVFHRRYRGLLRTLISYTRAHQAIRFTERTRQMNAQLPALLESFSECRAEITHPDPERAVFDAFSFTYTAMRERILFPESIPEPFERRDDELVEALTHNFLAYLGSA